MPIARKFLALTGVLAGLATLSAVYSRPMPGSHRVLTAHQPGGGAPLRAFGIRGNRRLLAASAARLDGALSDLIRHAGRARPASMLSDLRSLGPALRFRQGAADPAPLVLVDAVTRGDPRLLQSRLIALGMQGASVFSNDVGGWLPVSALPAAAGTPEVQALRAAMPRARASVVSSQGDFAQQQRPGSTQLPECRPAPASRSACSRTASTATRSMRAEQWRAGARQPGICALLGFLGTDLSWTATRPTCRPAIFQRECTCWPTRCGGNCLDYGAPYDLPFTDEGRAMLQIVHDVAPGASLAFHTADNSEADFANGILALAAAGARVEADDSGYFDEPFFQDGLLAQAIDTGRGRGRRLFLGCGQWGLAGVPERDAPICNPLASGPTRGEHLLNFDASGATSVTSLPITIPPLYPGDLVALVLEWDQPYVTGAPGSPGSEQPARSVRDRLHRRQ